MDQLWLFVVGVLLSAVGFLAVFVLNGIKKEISEIKSSLGLLEKDMRNGVSDLDRRITRVELKCENNHAHAHAQ